MIRTFEVTVNGKTFTAQVEETTPSAAARAAASMPAPKRAYAPVAPAAPAAPAPAAPAPAAPAAAPASGGGVTAPLPATVLKIPVRKGDAVKRGQVVIILEAMKMENEVFASADGTVTDIRVKEGDSVNTGDVLLTIG